MKVILKTNLNLGVRNRLSDYNNVKELQIATLLDPRFKAAAFTDASLLHHATTNLLNELRLQMRNGTSSSPSTSTACTTSEVTQITETSCLSYLKNRLPSNVNNPNAEQEFNEYLTAPYLPFDSNVFRFWKNYNGSQELKTLAEKVLSISATSVSSERLFSDAKNIITPQRNRLAPEKVNHLLFI